MSEKREKYNHRLVAPVMWKFIIYMHGDSNIIDINISSSRNFILLLLLLLLRGLVECTVHTAHADTLHTQTDGRTENDGGDE